jgi:hypothetical protein
VKAGTPPATTAAEPSPVLAASLVPGQSEGSVAALVTGAGLRANAEVIITVMASNSEVAAATIQSDTNGGVRWEAPVAASAGSQVSVRAETSSGGGTVTATARYVVPTTSTTSAP